MRLRSALAATLTCCALLAGCGTDSGVAASSPAALTSTSAAAASAASSSSAPSSRAASSAAAGPAIASAPSSAPSSAAASAPQRIVSLSPTATEDLFAIGAGSQVVAVDSASNFPVTAPKTELSAYKPNVEAIAKYKPDLVVLSDDIDNIKAQLTKLSIPVVVEPAAASLDDAYQQIQSLGTATGHVAEAKKTVATMRSGIAALVATVPKRAKPLSYFHELDNTLYTVSSKTFVGQVYGLAGLTNVADPGAKSTAYPQLSAESLVKANPDLVFLADTKCCQQTAATFAARPGFGVLSAVQNKHVVLLDDDVASRWGPRVVELLKRIVDAVKSVRSS
jgi:iron complex transport system substrate-binding protein